MRETGLRDTEVLGYATHALRVVAEGADALIAAATCQATDAFSACSFPGAAGVVVIYVNGP